MLTRRAKRLREEDEEYQRTIYAKRVRFRPPSYSLRIEINGDSIVSQLFKEGVAAFPVSEIYLRINDGELHIAYFHKPYLSGTVDALPGDVATAMFFARGHKHGSTHLCMLLRNLLQARIIFYHTRVTLDAVATVRTDNANQLALVGYYNRLSFRETPINTWGEGGTSMESTVRRVLNACERGMNAVHFM